MQRISLAPDKHLDRETVAELMRAQPRAMFGVCLGYAQSGDPTLVEILLDIGRSSDIQMDGQPIWQDTSLLTALLKAGCDRSDLVAAWLERRHESALGRISEDDFDMSRREEGLMVAVLDHQMELAEFIVKQGVDPTTPVLLRGEGNLPLPTGSAVGPWRRSDSGLTASPLAVAMINDAFATTWLERLPRAYGKGRLDDIPFGVRESNGETTSLLRLCAFAPSGAGRVAALLKHCDPDSMDVCNAVTADFSLLTRDLKYLSPDDQIVEVLAEILSFALDMPHPLGIEPATIDAMKYYQRSGQGNLVHALVDCGREAAAGRALLALKTRGIDIAASDSGGSTPLHMAAEAGSAHLVQVLLEAGLSTKARNDEGLTPEMVAHRAKQMETLAMLHAHDARAAVLSKLPNAARPRLSLA